MLSVLMVPFPRRITRSHVIPANTVVAKRDKREAVLKEGPSVYLSFSGSTGLDLQWASFVTDSVARGQHSARGLERC